MKKAMVVLAAGLGAAIMYSCSQGNGHGNAVEPGTNLSKDSLIKRGEYLVNAVGCADCHAPKKMGPNGPEPDMALGLSGHPQNEPIPKVGSANLQDWALFNHSLTAAVGPWGVSFSANLTPDETGIGSWTEQQFFRAIREGKSKGMENGRMLLPPMPWFMYRNFNDTDLRSIFYYLKSAKPVANKVPAPIPPTELAKK